SSAHHAYSGSRQRLPEGGRRVSSGSSAVPRPDDRHPWGQLGKRVSSHEQRGGRIEEVEQRWWILRVPDRDEPGTRSVQTLRLPPDAHVGRPCPIRIAPGGARPNGRQTRLGGGVHRRKLEQPPRRQRGQAKKDDER